MDTDKVLIHGVKRHRSESPKGARAHRSSPLRQIVLAVFVLVSRDVLAIVARMVPAERHALGQIVLSAKISVRGSFRPATRPELNALMHGRCAVVLNVCPVEHACTSQDPPAVAPLNACQLPRSKFTIVAFCQPYFAA
jgi:hypothetical protein